MQHPTCLHFRQTATIVGKPCKHLPQQIYARCTLSEAVERGQDGLHRLASSIIAARRSNAVVLVAVLLTQTLAPSPVAQTAENSHAVASHVAILEHSLWCGSHQGDQRGEEEGSGAHLDVEGWREKLTPESSHSEGLNNGGQGLLLSKEGATRRKRRVAVIKKEHGLDIDGQGSSSLNA
jgi:hypothetical protein